jgi:hypothetical protein
MDDLIAAARRAEDREARLIAADVVLLSYRLESVSSISRRSSL